MSTDSNHVAGQRNGYHEPIAIIGMSCLFPKAQSLEEYWANIKNGVDAISEVPPSHWSVDDYFDQDPKRADFTYSRRGGFLSPVEFDPAEFGVSPKTIEATDTAQLLSLIVAQGALADAGYGPNKQFDRDRVSVILGVTGTLELAISLGGRLGHPIWRRALEKAGVHGAVAEDVVKSIGDSYVAWQEDSFPGLLGNVVAGRIANRLNLGGTNCVVDAACASSISAAHLALMELQSGRSDMAITGGVDAFNDIFMYMCFSKTPALSPTGDSRPFDVSADGTVLGEGVGMVVLKRLADAERDGDQIYAVIRGIGSSSDGRGKAIYAPSAGGQAKALKQAYAHAGVSPATIELVEAHGTGTRVGDATEVAALNEVYGEAKRTGAWCALGSVKSQIGHTKAAAGVAGLIKAALALRHKVLPPTIKVTEPNPAVDSEKGPFYVNTRKRPWMSRTGHPRRAAVSSFGFGGSNFHLVLEEHGPKKTEVDWDGRVEIVALSAQNTDALKKRLQELGAGLSWPELKREAALSRREFKSSDPYRLILVIEQDKTDLQAVFKSHIDHFERVDGKSAWVTPDGAFFGGPRKVGKLGFLFPGQGSQYVGMCLDLACLFPKMQEILTDANVAYGDMTDLARQLTDFIFPLPAFNDEVRKLSEMALRATQRAQPAIGAVSMGAICILATFGVHPAAAAGHSFGELVALFAGGRINSTMLHHLSKLRGELMAEAAVQGGGMLAVQSPAEKIEKIKRDEALDVVLANINGPNQVVLSGGGEAIQRASAVLKSKKIPNMPLPVSAAFHSPLVEEAQRPFREALDDIDIQRGEIAVYSNTTAEVYPDDPIAARDLLGRQLASPVEFHRMIERMHADGVRTFVEIGPGARLTGLVKSILNNREHDALAVDASSGKESGVADLARTLARLASLGHEVDLTPWENGEQLLKTLPAEKSTRLTVSICGTNYRSPKAEKNHHAVEPMVTSRTMTNPPANPALPPAQAESSVPLGTPAPPPKQPPRSGDAGLGSAPASSSAASPFPSQAASASPSSPQTTSSTHRSGVAPQAQSARLATPGDAIAFDDPLLAEALRRTQESLKSMQELQEKTAALHRQFLDGQERTQQTYQWLLSQQQALFARALGLAEASDSDLPSPDSASFSVPQPLQEFKIPQTATAHRGSVAHEEASPRHLASADLSRVLLSIVSEKTGYPPDMLDLDMDMESDLGIDSIKRVEILSAVQERLPNAPVVEPDQIGRLRTLRQVIEFLDSDSRIETSESLRNVAREAAHEKVAPSGDLASILLGIVSDKTGYPPDMLKLDMDMEADLGIDSIKRVEILSAVQERLPDAPVVQPEDVAELRTLAQIIAFISASEAPSSAPSNLDEPSRPEARAEVPISTSNGNGNGNGAHGPAHDGGAALTLSSLVKVELPRTAQGEELELAPGAAIWITDDGGGLSRALADRLASRGFKSELIPLEEFSSRPVPSDLAGLLVIAPSFERHGKEAWPEISESWLKSAFQLVKKAGRSLRENGSKTGAFFATVSRLDGVFGLEDWSRGQDPLQGALAGLAKTAWHEWPSVDCRAIDAAIDWESDEELAAALCEEVLRDGPAEIGLSPTGRWTLDLAEGTMNDSASHGAEASPIQPGDVVIITGGARGVTAEAAIALAREYQPTLVLIGRSRAPGPEPHWLTGLHDEGEIKKAILIKGNGSVKSPKALEEEYRRHVTNREIIKNLARIEAAGSPVVYRSADIRNGEEVAKLLGEVRRELGPIRGLVHGAGVIADRKIDEKTAAQIDAVFDTKVAGLRSLLEGLKDDELKALVFFSSITARRGRAGQADYAMANEALNKIAQQQSRLRPTCRVVSLNWGPWEGGMVTNGLKKIFDAEGVDLIPLEAGGRCVADVLGSVRPGAVELAIVAANGHAAPASNGSASKLSLAFERNLDLQRHPFLRSHVIAGRPVVPVAIIVEWLAHGALHENPGLAFHGFDDLRVFRALAVEDDAAYHIAVFSAKAKGRASSHKVRVELRGGAGGETLHAATDVLLGAASPVGAGQASSFSPTDAYSRSVESIYSDVLFHGGHFRAIERVEACSDEGSVAKLAAAPTPGEWMGEPLRTAWIAEPLALDGALQLGLLWTYEQCGQHSLPSYIGSYRQFRHQFPRDGLTAVLRPAGQRGSLVVSANIELCTDSGALVARLEGCQFVMDPSLAGAFGHSPSPVAS